MSNGGKWRGLGLVIVGLILVGCVRGQTGARSTPGPTSTPANAGVSSASPSDCFNVQRLATPDTPTVERLSKRSPTVVVATFVRYGTPFWDTPDGTRPTLEAVNSGDAQILTPVELDVSGALKGRREVANRAVVWGGVIGCDTLSTDRANDLVGGSRYVIFLLPQTKPEGPTGNAWVLAAWAIGPNDEVDAPLDGPRSLGQLRSEIATGNVEATPTPGVEPSETYP